MKYPAKPEQFKMRIERITDHVKKDSHMMRIAPVAALECKLVVQAYYGGQWRTVFALFREAVYLTWHGLIGHLRIRFCDFMGWTKIYDIPQTATMRAHQQRHGKKCSGSPNCQNMDCIEESVPKWFRWLTRWDA